MVTSDVNDKLAGFKVFPKGTTLNVRSGPGTGTDILFTGSAGKSVGISTKYIIKNSAEGALFWLQIDPVTPRSDGKKYAYVRSDVFTLDSSGSNSNNNSGNNTNTNTEASTKLPVYTGKDGQLLLNSILKRDQDIYKGLLVNAENLNILDKLGVDVSKHKVVFESLLKKYKDRQNAIASADAYITSFKVINKNNLPPGFDWLYDKFSQVLSGLGFEFSLFQLGALPAYVIPVAGTAVVAVAASYLVYQLFIKHYDSQAKEFESSAILNKALATLTPAERKEALDTIQKQMDDTFKDGYDSGSDSNSLMSNVKTLAVIAISIWGGMKVIDYIDSKKKTKAAAA